MEVMVRYSGKGGGRKELEGGYGQGDWQRNRAKIGGDAEVRGVGDADMSIGQDYGGRTRWGQWGVVRGGDADIVWGEATKAGRNRR